MSRLWRAITMAVMTGVAGLLLALLPAAAALEDNLGLRWLFLARGPISPPSNVVIVSVDEATSVRADLPQRLRDWPRSIHAQAIDRLVAEGVAAIAFDVEFLRPSTRPEDDLRFAEALAQSGRVILVQRLERAQFAQGEIWQRQDPIPALASTAAALAPAPLPDLPIVAWFWLTVPTPNGDVRTLPVALAQLYASRSGFATGVMPSSQEGTAYLNFYGPAGTMCTVPYETLLTASADRTPCVLSNAIVLIGAGPSRVPRTDQIDTYETPYAGSQGVGFTGVELHATAVANLLEGRVLRALPQGFDVLLLLGFGAAAAGLAYGVRTRPRYRRHRVSARAAALIAAAAAGLAYAAVAFVLFADFQTVIPTVVPLAAQLPFAVVMALGASAPPRSEQVAAVCMATDAAGSTSLGQALPHSRYVQVMSDYTAAIARPVAMRGGTALDPAGDGLIGLWILPRDSEDNREVRRRACRAAADIACAETDFDQLRASADRPPTRVGMTLGVVTIWRDADRGVFKVAGDSVNVAHRLQALNAELGTRVLATPAVTDALDIPVRRAGPFCVKGVTEPIEVTEVLTDATVRRG